MAQINCHIPITIRVTGRPTDTQYEQLGEALVRSLSERIAFAERTIAEKHSVGAFQGAEERITASTAIVRDKPRLDRISLASRSYAIDSYGEGGDQVEVPYESLEFSELTAHLDSWLDTNANYRFHEIDWPGLLPELFAYNESGEGMSALDESNLERYLWFLRMLSDAVAQSGPADPLNLRPVTLVKLDHMLQSYLMESSAELFTEEAYDYKGYYFLNKWVTTIAALVFFPEGFDVELYRPSSAEREVEDERNRSVDQFVDWHATGLMTEFLLNAWANSGISPEKWLAELDFEEYHARLVNYLTDELVDMARKGGEYAAAAISYVVEKTRFDIVRYMFSSARGTQRSNDKLVDDLKYLPVPELDEAAIRVMYDPYVYWEIADRASKAYLRFLDDVVNGLKIETAFLKFIKSTQDQSEEFAEILVLGGALLLYSNLEQLIEQEKEAIRNRIADRIDDSLKEIEDTILHVAELAENFIQETWIPELRYVAKQKLRENRDELLHHLENWETYNLTVVTDLFDGADEFEMIADGLEEGAFISVELNGKTVTRKDVKILRDAAKLMRIEADARLDIDTAEEKMEQLQDAVEKFDSVIEDIDDGSISPLTYSRVVYAQARKNLDIGAFAEFTTVGMVLRRDVVASENPFLAWAIAGWKWRESCEAEMYRVISFAGRLTLSVAGMIVGGPVGIILAAIDIAWSAKDVYDAGEILNMASLDIRGDIVGITVEEAEAALTNAWIGFAASAIVGGGITVFRNRIAIKTLGGKIVRAGKKVPKAARELGEKAVEAGKKVPKAAKGLKEKHFVEPTTAGDPTMPAGEGATTAYGDVRYSTAGSLTDQQLAMHHEAVHQFLTPKLKYLRKFRAVDIRMRAYHKSRFMKYLEEALAESYAQLRVHGIKGLPTGIKFPVTNGYVELRDVVREGAIGTVLVGGILYGVYVISSE